MIIPRPDELRKINETQKWMLIYGRRKTGKTFLVKNFVKYDEYFFVKRDRTIVSEKGSNAIMYETLIEVIKRALAEDKVVVVDEFHRLKDDFFDFLHHTDKKGRLILISSTLFLSRKIFSEHSPLLGFFAEHRMPLISINDAVNALKNSGLDKKQLVEYAVVLREPIAMGYFDERHKNSRKTFGRLLTGSLRTVPALFGEVFVEEERRISAVYEGVARAIASGCVVSGKISSYLFSRGLIKKEDPSIIQQYLCNLEEFGLIKKIEVFRKNKFLYKHISPLARVFYYADEKYNISERELNEKETERIVDEIMPKCVEDAVREFLANRLGLKEAVYEAADFDIDACLLRFKKPEVVVEVKWRTKISKKDIHRAEINLSKMNAKRMILFVPDKSGLSSDIIEIRDISDFL